MMKYKTLLLIAFGLMIMAQLYVPFSMILSQEDILTSGTTFKFRAIPVDPEDPFRGRYMVLRLEGNSFAQDTGIWSYGEPIYVGFSVDKDGFSKVAGVSKDRPQEGTDYILTTVSSPPAVFDRKVRFEYPFSRYYMEENKATEAEKTYWNSLRDTSKVTYAVVNIKNGDFAMRDVMINGMSLKDLVDQESK